MKKNQLQKNNHLPKISIGMPVYNGEQFIRKALDSLLAQTLTDFELIISNNASSDRTGEICQEYAEKDARIRYVCQTENRGIWWNFTFVLNSSVSNYFMWASADDFWDSELLQTCVGFLDHHTDIDLCFPKFYILSRRFPHLFPMKHFPDMSFLASDDPLTRVSDFIMMSEYTYKANPIFGPWRKPLVSQAIEVINKILDQLDPRYAYRGADIALLAYVLTRNKIVQIPQVLFYKTYEPFARGSFPDRLLLTLKFLKYRNSAKQARIRSIDDHMRLLRMALSEAGVMNPYYEDVLNAKRVKQMKQIHILR